MNIILRNETEKDYFTVENLTREAFWNVYKPGCGEHLLVHNMRSLPCFIKELDIVAEVDGKIVGSILYSISKLTDLNGKEHELIAFGPISVHPDFQNKGIGSSLIYHTFRIAEQMGYTSVFITGNPDYYGRFGFETASNFGIHLKGVPIDDKAEFFMVKRLNSSALSGISGMFEFDPCYDVDQIQIDTFDKQFLPKVKEKRSGQIFD